MSKIAVKKKADTPTIRCAIYTRKSSEEGLAQEFNSLDAQREAAEAYIASQRAEGWIIVPERYDDGGYTGGNMDRPALAKLLIDIDAGKIDCVVVYKVGRLSRSLMDFAKIMETFDRHKVSFVSVTQHFNSANSMGRLMLNTLLSFAQYEREIIGERIRDKIAASRQKGKWTGGNPILGYDVDRSDGGPKLVVNPVEASRVRQSFDLYLELGSLIPVVKELNRRGWLCKAWTTRQGTKKGGYAFDKCRLHNLLTNILYAGKIVHKQETYPGEHEAIIPQELFDQVQARLRTNGRTGTLDHRNRHGALQRGILYCKACGRAMVHTYTMKGARRYRYYTCSMVMKGGRARCETASLPVAEIEAAVVDQIRCIGQDPSLVAETLRQARAQAESKIAALEGEKATIERALGRCQKEIKRLATADATKESSLRLAELHDQTAKGEVRLAEIRRLVAELSRELSTKDDLAAALGDFDAVWAALSPKEQARMLHLLIARVDYDSADSSIEVSFHATGIKALGAAADPEEAAA